MRRYGRRPSAADELRKKNALKLYEPHLSAETRRELEGKGKVAERTAGEVRCYQPDTRTDAE